MKEGALVIHQKKPKNEIDVNVKCKLKKENNQDT
jgi:hypothetical protein